MPHVADGILHAYIDGALDALDDAGELPEGMSSADVVAHLGSCADCRARLDAERSIRERAGLILHDAVPPRIETPPFAAVQGARRRRSLPFAWAASLLLAVGAGWWGSGLWRADALDQAATTRNSLVDSVARHAETASRTLQPQAAPGTDANTQSAASRTARTPDAAAAQVPAASDEQRTGAVAPLAAREASPSDTHRAERMRVASPEPLGVARADTVIARTEFAAPLAAAPPPAAAAPARDELAMNRSRITTAAEPRSFIEAAAADALAPITPGPEMLRFQALLSREQDDAILWRTWRPADSAAIADQLFVIADAPDASIDVAPEIGSTTLRVTQTLDSGETIELITWRRNAIELEALVVTGRSAAQPATEAASKAAQAAMIRAAADTRLLEDGRRELLLHDPATTTWIALRGDLSEERLRALSARLVRGVASLSR